MHMTVRWLRSASPLGTVNLSLAFHLYLFKAPVGVIPRGQVTRHRFGITTHEQLWSLHEQCHQLSGWGVVSLLYLLACALQYRYLNNMNVPKIHYKFPLYSGSRPAKVVAVSSTGRLLA
jgi:hypothetical protein